MEAIRNILSSNIITLEDLQYNYKNDELKTTSVDIKLCDYRDKKLDGQVNININEILNYNYVTEILVTSDNNLDNLFCAFSSQKNTTPYNFTRLHSSTNVLPKNIILPLSKMQYTPLYLILTNTEHIDNITLHFKYYDEHINDVVCDSMYYSLYIDEVQKEFRIASGMWSLIEKNNTQLNSIKIINDAFDNCNFQELCVINSSEAFSFFVNSQKDIYLYGETHSPKEDEINRGPEFAFALKHSHVNPVKCSIISVNHKDTTIIHEFIALPNKPQWLLNGIPLFLIKTPQNRLFCKYTDMTTNEQVFIKTEIFKGYLSMDIRQHLGLTNQLCSLGNNKFIFYSQRDLNIINLHASLDNFEGYFKSRENL